MGDVGVVVFLLGGWTLAPRRKIEKRDCKMEISMKRDNDM